MRSAPLGTLRTASHIRGSGRPRRAGARLLLAGENAVADGLRTIHDCRLENLLRVVCDEGVRTFTEIEEKRGHGALCAIQHLGIVRASQAAPEGDSA